MSVQCERQTVDRKRKADLLDYFTPDVNVSHQKRLASVGSRTTELPTADKLKRIPGLSVLQDFVTAQEERDLSTFLDAQQWRTDLARRVIHYGGTYCLMPPRDASSEQRKLIESTIYEAASIPNELDFVVDRMVQRNIYPKDHKPEYCIVNSYQDNQGISAHVENFRFASPVCGLTLLSGDWMRFHELVVPDDGSVRSGLAAKAERTGRRIDVWMPRRSLIVMSGEARQKWQHEIVRGKKDRVGPAWRRVSLTFRTLKASEGSE